MNIGDRVKTSNGLVHVVGHVMFGSDGEFMSFECAPTTWHHTDGWIPTRAPATCLLCLRGGAYAENRRNKVV